MRHWIWLYTVMVHPRHQGKGYGRDLLAAAADAARAIGRCHGDTAHLPRRCGTGAVLRVLRLQGGRAGARGDQGRRRGLSRRHHDAAPAPLTPPVHGAIPALNSDVIADVISDAISRGGAP